MKPISLIGLSVCAAILVGCETTKVSGTGNQEAKRLAAIQQQRQKPPPEEAHANLWNAQENMLDRDSNPLRAY